MKNERKTGPKNQGESAQREIENTGTAEPGPATPVPSAFTTGQPVKVRSMKPDVYKIVMKDSMATMPRELSLVCLVRTMAQEFDVTPEHMARKLIGACPMFREWVRERTAEENR